MAWFSTTTLDSLETLLVDQLNDLYDAEQRLVLALPKMAEAACDHRLKRAFLMHLAETEQHVRRLERVFELLQIECAAKTCEAMKGLISEGQEAIDAGGDPGVKDAALIAAAQRVEHYEIAAYGTVRTFALHLNHQDVARLLQETLDEEKATDEALTTLAESGINQTSASQ
jgi:ferritin-like metal-binding protein YciE